MSEKYDIWSLGVLLWILAFFPNDPFSHKETRQNNADSDSESDSNDDEDEDDTTTTKAKVRFDDYKTMENIKKSRFSIENWQKISNDNNVYKSHSKCVLLIDLINNCLIADPDKRPSAEKLLNHKIFDLYKHDHESPASSRPTSTHAYIANRMRKQKNSSSETLSKIKSSRKNTQSADANINAKIKPKTKPKSMTPLSTSMNAPSANTPSSMTIGSNTQTFALTPIMDDDDIDEDDFEEVIDDDDDDVDDLEEDRDDEKLMDMVDRRKHMHGHKRRHRESNSQSSNSRISRISNANSNSSDQTGNETSTSISTNNSLSLSPKKSYVHTTRYDYDYKSSTRDSKRNSSKRNSNSNGHSNHKNNRRNNRNKGSKGSKGKSKNQSRSHSRSKRNSSSKGQVKRRESKHIYSKSVVPAFDVGDLTDLTDLTDVSETTAYDYDTDLKDRQNSKHTQKINKEKRHSKNGQRIKHGHRSRKTFDINARSNKNANKNKNKTKNKNKKSKNEHKSKNKQHKDSDGGSQSVRDPPKIGTSKSSNVNYDIPDNNKLERMLSANELGQMSSMSDIDDIDSDGTVDSISSIGSISTSGFSTDTFINPHININGNHMNSHHHNSRKTSNGYASSVVSHSQHSRNSKSRSRLSSFGTVGTVSTGHSPSFASSQGHSSSVPFGHSNSLRLDATYGISSASAMSSLSIGTSALSGSGSKSMRASPMAGAINNNSRATFGSGNSSNNNYINSKGVGHRSNPFHLRSESHSKNKYTNGHIRNKNSLGGFEKTRDKMVGRPGGHKKSSFGSRDFGKPEIIHTRSVTSGSNLTFNGPVVHQYSRTPNGLSSNDSNKLKRSGSQFGFANETSATPKPRHSRVRHGGGLHKVGHSTQLCICCRIFIVIFLFFFVFDLYYLIMLL